MNVFKRMGYGIIFAILVILVVFLVSLAAGPAFAQGETVGEPDSQALSDSKSKPECKECHPAFHEAWQNSGHGMATTDPVFVEAWEAQGSPGQCLTALTSRLSSATKIA